MKKTLENASTRKLLMLLVPALIIVQVVAFVFLHFANRNIALESVDSALEGGAQTFLYTAATRKDNRQQTSLLVTKDYGLQHTISNGNRATIESALASQLARTGAELIVLTDLNHKLVARASATQLLNERDEDLDAALEALATEISETGRSVGPLAAGEHTPVLYNWVKSTISAPTPFMNIFLGYRINTTAVEQFTKMTQLKMAFLSQESEGDFVIHTSTLPGIVLNKSIQEHTNSSENFSAEGTDGAQYRAKVINLGGLRGSNVIAVVAKPFAPVFSPFLRLEGLFAASILFSSFISILAANHITNRVVIPLEDVAHRDALTHLANRRLFEINLQNAEQNQQVLNTGYAILLMDLDKFKAINDNYGHEAGDAVLKEVALRTRKHVRSSDTLARLGGDEFAILMRSQDLQRVQEAATAIVTDIRQPIQVRPDQWVSVGASIGIARSPENSTLSAQVLHCADLAMYAAKQQACGFQVYEDPPVA